MSSAPADTGTFLFIWVGFSALMILGITLVFLWGVRARQFENQDRARYLPLWSGIVDEAEETEGGAARGSQGEDGRDDAL